jgi:hypothetical protein
MGAYTQSIREILQMHKTSSQSLMNVQDVHDIAAAYLFDEIPVNVISAEYLDAFITGFTLHFINEELGLETLPMWKIALNEKIYNNGGFINLIFENLDKQIFADYKVHLVTSQDTHSNTKLGTGTLTNQREEDTTTDVTDNITHSETASSTIENEVRGTGTIQNTKTGSDTISHTGTDETAKTGTDTTGKTGTDTSAKSGSDILAQTGTDASAHTGTEGNVGTNTSQTLNTGTTGTDHNSQQINSDTPMGSLQNLRTPGGNAKGTGVNYVNGQTYNYMTSAAEFDESSVQTDNTQQDVTGSDSSTTTFNDTTTETRNLQDETTYNSKNTRTVNLQDETTYDNQTERTVNLEDETTYGSVGTETRNTSDVTERTDSSQKSGTQGKTGQTVVDGSVTDTQTRNLSDTDSGTKNGTVNESEYSLNWEMLFKTMPLLNRVWGIFDDLFMLIY